MKFILAILALATIGYAGKPSKMLGKYEDNSENINIVKERGAYPAPKYDHHRSYNMDDGYNKDDLFGSGSNIARAAALLEDDLLDDHLGYGGGYGGHDGQRGYGGYSGYGNNDRDNNRNRNRNRNANANANANRDENENRNRNNAKSKNAVEDTINVSI